MINPYDIWVTYSFIILGAILSLFFPTYWSTIIIFFKIQFKLEVFVRTKAVLNRNIVFVKAVFLIERTKAL